MVKVNLDLALLRAREWLMPKALRKAIVREDRRAFRQRLSSIGKRRLFIDLAVVSRHDAGTGIQRVVRALALALLTEEGNSWDIRFVAADRRNAYHEIDWPNARGERSRQPISGQPGDVFFGLDFSLDTVQRYKRQLTQFRRDGGQLWFLVCDLLPVDRPEWFSPPNVLRYKAWLNTIASIGDGFFCISPQTQADLRRAFADRYALHADYQTLVIPMGYEIRESLIEQDEGSADQASVRFDANLPYNLMVGTLEPRKGHWDVLDAFDTLWQKGSSERLVIVGRQGWQVEKLTQRIRSHPLHEKLLFWFDDVADSELDLIYQQATGVIVASHGEGFGLPLIEALGHGKPVLARDLSVFRLHEDRGVAFFPPDMQADDLGKEIERWNASVSSDKICVRSPVGDWRTSARMVLSALA